MPSGTLIITKRSADSYGSPNRLQLDWTSDLSQNVSQNHDTTNNFPLSICGTVQKVTFVPSGSAAPTNLYDVTLTDDAGIDILAGQGANLSSTVSTSICPTVAATDGTTTATAARAVHDLLTLVVANAGVTKSGTVYIYYK